MFNLSGGGWIVEALKMFEKSPVLRRMFYAVVTVALVFAIGYLTGKIRWW